MNGLVAGTYGLAKGGSRRGTVFARCLNSAMMWVTVGEISGGEHHGGEPMSAVGLRTGAGSFDEQISSRAARRCFGAFAVLLVGLALMHVATSVAALGRIHSGPFR